MNAPSARLPWIRRALGQRGLTLLETMIAALILLFVLLAMVSGYSMGRINLDREEVKRRATGLAQDRLEEIKARAMGSPGGFTRWVVKSAIDTTYTLDTTVFTLTSTVTPNVDVDLSRIVAVDVGWTINKSGGGTAARSIRSTTVITKNVSPGS
jgi:Tfp pilus assembly protein PilV